MSTATAPATRPEFVFVRYDDAPDRPDGMPSDRERFAIHRSWLHALDSGTMPASKVALLDTWAPGWRSDAARRVFAAVPSPHGR
ncbi:hypothetical protein [Cellulomonas aerilata]|uniref:Uncharacterized protein n=1 Tax=Cellulomonas aerilata TaxID=515326 RepID=A0A512DCN0_9CELL|nr:hypothetical protein [Cellulomonas aerilata]GEO34187.1 hypothetical protein CAE01nite_19120 [Cellulomonas aerilata]